MITLIKWHLIVYITYNINLYRVNIKSFNSLKACEYMQQQLLIIEIPRQKITDTFLGAFLYL